MKHRHNLNRIIPLLTLFLLSLNTFFGLTPALSLAPALAPRQADQSMQSLQSSQLIQSLQYPQSEASQIYDTIIKKRLSSTDLTNTIIGAIITLDDTQIRNRAGKNAALYDSTEHGDGAKGIISISLPFFKKSLKLPVPDKISMKNRLGEWASSIHFMPKKMGFKGINPVAVLDSNLFMTAFVTYPLYLFRESSINPQNRRIAAMRDLAVQNIESYRRGNAFNFWALIPGTYTDDLRSGPFNIPVPFLKALSRAYINPKLSKFWSFFTKNLDAPPTDWIKDCLSDKNPTGADALFNIPNDSDDTSTAVAVQKLYNECPESRKDLKSKITADLDALKIITQYRDINRQAEDGRDSWKGKNSGAYLTWLLPESAPVFSQPEKGVIPLGVNNVDCVVNANVLFSLSLNNMTDAPGYTDCARLCIKAVNNKTWPRAGLYYPQEMIFPYSVTRAWRDGGMVSQITGSLALDMKKAMIKLLKDLLESQRAYAVKKPSAAGAFPGGEDKSDHLSTALGLTSMLNIGRDAAIEAGLLTEYDKSLKQAVAYLIKKRIKTKPLFDDTMGVYSIKGTLFKPRAYTFNSGLFFAASFWDLAHWRSRAFTVSMVIEALSKYALAYEYGGVTINKGRKLDIYTNPVTHKNKENIFALKVTQQD